MSAGIQQRKLETTVIAKTPYNVGSSGKESKDQKGLAEAVKSSESWQRSTKYKLLRLQIEKGGAGSLENGLGGISEGCADSQLVLPHQV